MTGPREGDLVIAGREMERAVHVAMARAHIASLAELSRRTGIRRDTFYIWFRKDRTRVSAASLEKLVAEVGAEPGDPWFSEPIERRLDPESLAAVERAMDRLGDRLIEWLDRRLGNARPGDG